ncbi:MULTISPECIES: cell division protein FtsI [unclassified Rubrivivax]|uniref:cell division protein FtsI n=1 Tax=unclassified Rubrivivax TaxID=2649762 RepID=UPI001E308C7F|nr:MULTISPECIES: cell division protein FtsI [unclassified Rubrivivax]MCC9597314.1 cell division protein FtsI [Rubrivivax sp. JA1055]MCC9646429.1 cell division protein FtsI [Rubrivivax sp. JA1029]
MKRSELAAAAATLLLSGCSLVSPLPTLELAKAAGAAVQHAVLYGPSEARHTVFHEPLAVSALCIEYRPDAQIVDFVPSLQAELKARRIDSRVYEEGTPRQTCDAWLRYTAAIAWDTTPFAAEYRPYLRQASLTLQTSSGRTLATSQYRLEGLLEAGKWSSTRDKLAPVVSALLTGA